MRRVDTFLKIKGWSREEKNVTFLEIKSSTFGVMSKAFPSSTVIETALLTDNAKLNVSRFVIFSSL